MALRWFNLIGFLMLFSALFFNEVVYLNVWYGNNYSVVIAALVYLGTGIWLSIREGSCRQNGPTMKFIF